jgi:hypothetical protein
MKKIILFLLVVFISNTAFAQLNITSRNSQPEKVMSIRPGYSQLYYEIEESDTLYYFSINTDNRFDNPIYFTIGYGKNSAIQSVEDLIEIAEKGNENNETISVPGMYTDDKIYISSAAIFGIKGLILTQRGHAGVSNLNLGELRRVSKKLKSQE